MCMTACNQVEGTPSEIKVKAGSCKKRGVTYEIACITKMRKRIRTRYVGETGQSAFERGKDHLDGLRRAAREGTLPKDPKERDNALYRHHIEEHRGEEPEYWMRVTSTHKTPMQRQVEEAVRIEEARGRSNITLNRKSEWRSSRIPRIRI